MVVYLAAFIVISNLPWWLLVKWCKGWKLLLSLCLFCIILYFKIIINLSGLRLLDVQLFRQYARDWTIIVCVWVHSLNNFDICCIKHCRGRLLILILAHTHQFILTHREYSLQFIINFQILRLNCTIVVNLLKITIFFYTTKRLKLIFASVLLNNWLPKLLRAYCARPKFCLRISVRLGRALGVRIRWLSWLQTRCFDEVCSHTWGLYIFLCTMDRYYCLIVLRWLLVRYSGSCSRVPRVFIRIVCRTFLMNYLVCEESHQSIFAFLVVTLACCNSWVNIVSL